MKATRLSVMLVAGSMILAGHAIAETKTVTKQYSYKATETDSRQSARWTALEETRQLLISDLAAYLETLPEVKGLALTKDELIPLVYGITTPEVIKEDWNKETYWMDVKISVDVGNAIMALDRLRHNNGLKRELERQEQLVSKALSEKLELKKRLDAAYYDINKTEEYEGLLKQSTNKQTEGESFLAQAKEAEKKSGSERQAREFRQKAVEFLGEARVLTELPEFRIYIPGKYSFPLRAGEQTDHWLVFPDGETKFKLFQEKGSRFERVYDDGTAHAREKVFGQKMFKLKAVKNSYIILEVMKR